MFITIDISNVRAVLQPFVQFFSALILSGISSTIATQIMKSDFWLLRYFNVKDHPRIYAGVVSAIAAVVGIYSFDLNLVLTAWWHFLAFGFGTFLVGIFTYNSIAPRE
jgi:hypothetical protein